MTTFHNSILSMFSVVSPLIDGDASSEKNLYMSIVFPNVVK
jgi:hypothetical protein